jgi:transposase InsO family protein
MTLATTLWWSAAELAAADLPGLPSTERGVQLRAKSAAWAAVLASDGAPLARKRAGRGGGVEYHISLLPVEARVEMARRAVREAERIALAAPVTAAPIAANDEACLDATVAAIEGERPVDARWARWEQAGAKGRARAQEALAIIGQVEALMATGLGKTVALHMVAASSGKQASTIKRWFAAIAGVPASDRLACLVPGFKGGAQTVDIDDALWQALRSDYLRLSEPGWEGCVRRVVALAEKQGKALPSARTLWRRLEATVPVQARVLLREGEDALRKLIPPQKRSVADLKAMELVNIDGHTCDVRVRFEDGTIGRPVLIAIQDVMSRKFLAWRYAKSEDAITARLCFADLFRKWGVPHGLLADNGRAFACKWLTGGVPTRFRFTVKPDEPIGLMAHLGIEVHWALPYRGSSKPIERGFRDFCDAIAKHPAFEGAYTGNNALNKPDNYGERVVEWADFVRVWDGGIAEHNARRKRGTEMARGVDSFDAVFDRSRALHGIREATDSHLRLALLAGEQVRAHRTNGSVTVLRNRYWHPDLAAFAGKLVTVRFDPEDALQPVHVYDRDRLIAVADMEGQAQFLDASGAKRRMQLERDLRRTTKAAARAQELLEADQLAAIYDSLLPDYEDETPPKPTVVRPVRVRGNTALKPIPQADPAPAVPDFMDTLMAGAARRLRAVNE